MFAGSPVFHSGSKLRSGDMDRFSAFFLLLMFVLAMSLFPMVLTKRQCTKACRTYISSEVEEKVSKALRVNSESFFLLLTFIR